MTEKILYTTVLPGDALQGESSDNRSAVQNSPTINADFGSVQSTGSEPSATPLNGQVRGKYADGMAKEISELASNSDIEEVVVYGSSAAIETAGYYTVERGETNAVDPRSPNLQQYRVRLGQVGTRTSHYRATETKVVNITNPFTTGDVAYVGAHSNAKNVRWFNRQSRTEVAVSPTTTVSAEHGDIDLYDAYAAPIEDPMLIYDLPYEKEGYIDPRLYDDRGVAQFDNGNRAWDRVYVSKHDYIGAARLDNGLVRVKLDEDNDSLSFETWNNSTQSWDAGTLNNPTGSDWTFRDVTFTTIGASRIEMQLRFEDANSLGDFYRLNASLRRGLTGLMFVEAENETTIPTDLKTRLTPLASTENGRDAQPTQTVLPRREVMA